MSPLKLAPSELAGCQELRPHLCPWFPNNRRTVWLVHQKLLVLFLLHVGDGDQERNGDKGHREQILSQTGHCRFTEATGILVAEGGHLGLQGCGNGTSPERRLLKKYKIRKKEGAGLSKANVKSHCLCKREFASRSQTSLDGTLGSPRYLEM